MKPEKGVSIISILAICIAVSLLPGSCSMMAARFGEISDLMVLNSTNTVIVNDFDFSIETKDEKYLLKWESQKDVDRLYPSVYNVFVSEDDEFGRFTHLKNVAQPYVANSSTKPECEFSIAERARWKWVRIRCEIANGKGSTVFVSNAAHIGM